MTIDTLTPIEQRLIDRFVSKITKINGVESIYLFGSRAKGKGHLESDIDIAIIVKEEKILKKMSLRAIELSIEIEEELNVGGELVLTPLTIDESSLKLDIGIGRVIREEGILLWSKKLIRKKRRSI